MQALEARLDAIRSSANLSLAVSREADLEMRRLTRMHRRERTLRAAFALGWMYWYRHLAIPHGSLAKNGGRALSELLPCFMAGLKPIPDELLPELAVRSCRPAVLILNKALNEHDPDAIVDAAALCGRVHAAIPAAAPEWPAMTTLLGVAMQGTFVCTRNLAALDEAIDLGRRCIETAARDDPRLAVYLNEYGTALRLRFDNSGGGGGQYIDEAIAVYGQAVGALPAGRPERAGMLSNLGAALRARFEFSRTDTDLREAISYSRQAVEAARLRDPRRRQYLQNLAAALRTQYADTGEQESLAESIALLRRALSGLPPSHPDQAKSCSNLAAALWARSEAPWPEFHDRSTAEDLDEVISLLRAAVSALRPGDPGSSLVLSNLSVAVWARFERAGARADLDAAVDIGRQAVAACADGNVNQARYLSNLCTFLRESGDSAAAVEAGQRAVAATATDDLERRRRLSNLANALRDAGDVDAAIATLRLAADQGDPEIESNLAVTLHSAGHTEEAITVLRQALDSVPANHPSRPGMLANLASAYRGRFSLSGSMQDRATAMHLFAEAADLDTAGPYLRARMARAACLAADFADNRQLRQAARLLEMAVGLLPAIAPRRLGRIDQQRYLADLGGIASDAAALAVAVGGDANLERALGLLEMGRGVLLSQALDTRTDVTVLQARHPRLAASYARLRDQLDREPSEQPENGRDEFAGAALSLERRAGDRQRLAAAFAATIAEIRQIAGFSEFMRPPSLDDLMRPTRNGAVVVLNLSDYRSDALLLTLRGISSVRLPDLTPATVRARALALRENSRDALPLILDWLWDVVTGPVLRELGFDRAVEDGPWPHVWWVAAGPLSLLPIHAAGPAMDRVISSYTPTIRALAHAQGISQSADDTVPRSLIVAMRTSPGNNPELRWAAREAASVRRLLPHPAILMEPAKATVLRYLDKCTVVHFACHGVTDAADPSRSGLVLADLPLTVAALAALRLNVARLAYLSACRTAVGDADGLSDEAIHIASACQLAGFPHVIGTLWPIDDHMASVVAASFYESLRVSSGRTNPALAAQALHRTMRQLRAKYPEKPTRWASHIHVGA